MEYTCSELSDLVFRSVCSQSVQNGSRRRRAELRAWPVDDFFPVLDQLTLRLVQWGQLSCSVHAVDETNTEHETNMLT